MLGKDVKTFDDDLNAETFCPEAEPGGLDLPDPEAQELLGDEEDEEEEIKLPYHFPLKYPFEVAGKTWTELVFRRRPTTYDAKGVPVGMGLSTEHVCQIAGRLCGIDPAVLQKKLDLSDFGRMQAVVSRFL